MIKLYIPQEWINIKKRKEENKRENKVNKNLKK